LSLDAIRFREEKKLARLHDPRRNFELAEVGSEIRFDPLTGASGRICHFSLASLPLPDLSGIVAETKTNCPFCPGKVESITPRFPEDFIPGGRMRRGDALLFPNLFPYDDISAVAAICGEHFHPMAAVPPQIVCDGVGLARDFFRLAGGRVEGGSGFGLATWNYMPPAGGTQIHPHMQVVLTANPGNAVTRELEAEAAFLGRHGACYAEMLLQAERARGERFIAQTDAVAWLVPFAPVGLFGDCMALFPGRATLAELTDADIADFAQGLARVLRGFAGRGLWSFNLTFFPARFGAGDGAHWLSARLLPRFYLNPKLHVTDASYMQLLLEERFAMTYPEQTAAMLRAAFHD
jgi:UDPglucose--hexose-1-phosphate uridylyltransferase